MNDNILKMVEEVIESRKTQDAEGSYTCYLFQQGTDKILKKCGEECSEVIIAAKNGENTDTENEICDLLYHLMVLMAQQNIPLDNILAILKERSLKIGNLKQMRQTDKNT